MIVSQTQLAILYLSSLLMGGCLGLLYDGFRITRIFLGEHFSSVASRFEAVDLPLIGAPRKPQCRKRLRAIVLFVGDFLFCVIASVLLILLFYRMNHGKIRFMTFVLAGSGFYLYRITIGKMIMLCSETIAFVLQTVIRYVCFFVLFPFRWVAGKTYMLAKEFVKRQADARMKRIRRRYTADQMEHLESIVEESLLGEDKKKGVRYRGGKKEAIQP